MCGGKAPRLPSRGPNYRAAAWRWALEGLCFKHLTIERVAEGLDVSWNIANDAVLAEGKLVVIADPGRFDGVRVIGVDEHGWRHAVRETSKHGVTLCSFTAAAGGTTGPNPRPDTPAPRRWVRDGGSVASSPSSQSRQNTARSGQAKPL